MPTLPALVIATDTALLVKNLTSPSVLFVKRKFLSEAFVNPIDPFT